MSRETVSSQPFSPGEKQVTPWPEASIRLEEAETDWLATVHPDCQPHVVPVLAVWLDGALYFSTAPSSQKGKNLAHDSRCTITAHPQLHLVVEGSAARVRDEARLQRVAEAYATKYESSSLSSGKKCPKSFSRRLSNGWRGMPGWSAGISQTRS